MMIDCKNNFVAQFGRWLYKPDMVLTIVSFAEIIKSGPNGNSMNRHQSAAAQ